MSNSRKQAKILIVEPSLLLLGLYEKKLVLTQNWQVKSAASLELALEICYTFKPDIIIISSSLINELNKRILADLTLGCADHTIPVIIVGPLDLPKEFSCVRDSVLGFVDMGQNDLNDLVSEVKKVIEFSSKK